MKTKLIFLISISALVVFADNKYLNELNQNIKNWNIEVKEGFKNDTSSRSYINFKTPHYYKIINMGPKIIPLLIKREKEKKSNTMIFLPELAKINFRSKSTKKNNTKQWYFFDYPDFFYIAPAFRKERHQNIKFTSIWVYWWDKGRKFTPRLFKNKYNSWVKAKASNNKKQMKDKYTDLQNMGIIILPLLLEKIKSGDKDLIPMFSYLSNKKVHANASMEACDKWWKANKNKYKKIIIYPKMK